MDTTLITQDLLEYANSLPAGFYSISTASDTPNAIGVSATGYILRRTGVDAIVALYGISSGTLNVNHYDGHTWLGWLKYTTNTDLGNATFWFPTFVLGWDSYTNGTHQLTQSIANKPLLICAGKNGSLSGFWTRTQANDDRVIMTPEGVITIHFDSLTQITITGATSTWNVRSIQIF